ncbi:hypothetical protein SFR_3191 [Streptomyces sp. FR-008]|nr:hypothetical protein SFR_3191 [Streptomyces sp. FR-008]
MFSCREVPVPLSVVVTFRGQQRVSPGPLLPRQLVVPP